MNVVHKGSRFERRRDRLYLARRMTGFDKAVFLQSRKIVYFQRELKMCRCGSRPYIERDMRSKKLRWIIRCPGCGLRIREPAYYTRAREQWNSGDYSEASVTLSRKLEDIDVYGMAALYRVLFGSPEEEQKHA